MIILAVGRPVLQHPPHPPPHPLKACFHFSCVSISYACASCLCYCVLLTMITFFWSLSLLQDLKPRTKLEGIVAAREGNFSQLLILTYCLCTGLSYIILKCSLCLQQRNHTAHKLPFHNCLETLDRSLSVRFQSSWKRHVSCHDLCQSADISSISLPPPTLPSVQEAFY